MLPAVTLSNVRSTHPETILSFKDSEIRPSGIDRIFLWGPNTDHAQGASSRPQEPKEQIIETTVTQLSV